MKKNEKTLSAEKGFKPAKKLAGKRAKKFEKRVIYSTDWESDENLRDDAIENILINLEEQGVSLSPGELEEERIQREINFLSRDNLDIVVENLSVPLDDNILIIADLGTWQGRRAGYKELGNNFSEILSGGFWHDDIELYMDKYGQVRGRDIHHDGTNFYLFRKWKKDVSEERREKLLKNIYNDTFSRQEIYRKTESLGKVVKKVYGW